MRACDHATCAPASRAWSATVRKPAAVIAWRVTCRAVSCGGWLLDDGIAVGTADGGRGDPGRRCASAASGAPASVTTAEQQHRPACPALHGRAGKTRQHFWRAWSLVLHATAVPACSILAMMAVDAGVPYAMARHRLGVAGRSHTEALTVCQQGERWAAAAAPGSERDKGHRQLTGIGGPVALHHRTLLATGGWARKASSYQPGSMLPAPRMITSLARPDAVALGVSTIRGRRRRASCPGTCRRCAQRRCSLRLTCGPRSTTTPVWPGR